MNDLQIQAQAYGYFLAEAPELLQTIEQEILTLPSERTTAKVHNLMRALHTLKGAAANVGLTTIERIAHDFEDVTRVFYNLEVEIDVPIQSLMLDGYSGLQECLEAQIMDREIDEQAIADRMVATVTELKLKLGDLADADVALPTAIELGFDIVASIFETTIQEQIETLSAVIDTHNLQEIAGCLESIAEIGIGLAESFELPGFLEIQQTIIAALTRAPDRIEAIADLALQNLQQAQAQVLAGDRISGGTVLPDLALLAHQTLLETPTAEEVTLFTPVILPAQSLEQAIETVSQPEIRSNQIILEASGEAQLTAFRAFLISDRFRKRHELSADTQHLFNQIIRLCWDWFRQVVQTPYEGLNFTILVLDGDAANLDYIHNWIGLLLQGVSSPSDRPSLLFYRQCCLYQVVFAVAKYLSTQVDHPQQITPAFLHELRLYLQTTAETYQAQSPITANERGWIDRIVLPYHWSKHSLITTEEDFLLSEIWGQQHFGDNIYPS